MPLDKPTFDDKQKQLRKAQRFLAKHFPHFRIVATYQDSADETELVTTGNGDTYAQMGAVRAWLTKQDGYLTGIAVREAQEDMDDEEDTPGEF